MHVCLESVAFINHVDIMYNLKINYCPCLTSLNCADGHIPCFAVLQTSLEHVMT